MYRYIGKDFPSDQPASKASGALKYCSDIRLPGMLYLKLIVSPVPHGTVRSVDAEAARAVPGVARILTYEDTPDLSFSREAVHNPEIIPAQEPVFTRHVRFVGDRIGAVVAETPAAALHALSLVRLDIENAPAYLSPESALEASGASGTDDADSVVRIPAIGFGDYDSAEGSEFVQKTSVQRISHIAAENHCAAADYCPGTGEMTVYTPNESVFSVRSAVSGVTGLPMSRVRVRKTSSGGSFGSRQEVILEPVAALASMLTGRPVLFSMNRRETMLCTSCRHPVTGKIRARFTEDHRLTGIRLEAVLDAGAYQTVTPDLAVSMAKSLYGAYDYPNLECLPVCVCTNTPVSGIFRGRGGPEAAFIMETMLNGAARAFGTDPVELRLKNLLPGDPASAGSPLREVLELGKKEFRWEERKQRIARQDRSSRYLNGIGMAVSAHPVLQDPDHPVWSSAVLKMAEDGSVTISCSLHDRSFGQAAAMRKIAAEVLDMDPDRIAVCAEETAYGVPDCSFPAPASVFATGKAVETAARELKARILSHAAGMFGVPEEDVLYTEGTFCVIGHPRQVLTLAQAAGDCAVRSPGSLLVMHTCPAGPGSGPAAAHFAEVRIDTRTGKAEVTDYLAVQDVGTAVSPETCRSRIGSAVQQGIGAVFCEDLDISKSTGRARGSGPKRYPIARAAEMPRLSIRLAETPDPCGPFGAKSIGETAFEPCAPALLAAVNDALDADLASLPLTPSVILRTFRKEL